ncbi:hypothetical protein Dimus_025028 [Dionaea muscipula]
MCVFNPDGINLEVVLGDFLEGTVSEMPSLSAADTYMIRCSGGRDNLALVLKAGEVRNESNLSSVSSGVRKSKVDDTARAIEGADDGMSPPAEISKVSFIGGQGGNLGFGALCVTLNWEDSHKIGRSVTYSIWEGLGGRWLDDVWWPIATWNAGEWSKESDPLLLYPWVPGGEGVSAIDDWMSGVHWGTGVEGYCPDLLMEDSHIKVRSATYIVRFDLQVFVRRIGVQHWAFDYYVLICTTSVLSSAEISRYFAFSVALATHGDYIGAG